MRGFVFLLVSRLRHGLRFSSESFAGAADNVEFTLQDDTDRKTQLWLVKLGEHRLEFDLVVWLTTEGLHRPEGARAAYCWAICAALRKRGIEVPLPQRDLHLKTAVPVPVAS